MNAQEHEVITLSEAAGYLRLPEGEILRMVREQGRPARQVGSEWRFFRPAVNDWLRIVFGFPTGKDWLEAEALLDDSDIAVPTVVYSSSEEANPPQS